MSRLLNKNAIFCCILLAGISLNPIAQEHPQVSVKQADEIRLLLEKHRDICKLFPEIDGFRIQIYFNSGHNSKSQAFEVYKQFIANYPGVEAYVSYQEPNYKVRAGDFRTRLEAEGFLRKIQADYPSAFVIKDQVLFPPLH
jgi:hypothetical protein